MNRFFKDSLNLIKSYKWNSIFFRYFKNLIFITILPAIIFIAIILNYYITSVTSDISTAQRYDIIKSVTQFDKAYDAILNISENIKASPLTREIILGEKKAPEEYSLYSDFLNTEKNGYLYINSISVYNPRTKYVASSYSGNDISNFRDTSWLKVYNEGFMDFSIHASPKGIKSSNMINICRNLLIDNRTMGLIIFTVDGDILADEMYSGDINETENILLFNEDNELIYASSLDVFEKLNIDANKILEETTYKRETEFSSGEYLYNAIASENHDFKIISALSMQAYNKDYRHIISIALLYFLITFVLAVIFSLIIAFRFYRSIVDIVIKTASTEETPENVTANENNELVYLSDTLFNTVKNHQKIESELVDKIAKLKKVQSIALQTQINPHFLFNSLNLVNGFILEECRGESTAATMLSNISDILYIALNTKEYIVTLETELEYAKKYLSIEQIKYPGKFTVEYDIAPETLDLKTVKFVIQPIIENAIEHGIKHITDKAGVISISSNIINNRLIISISNNGPKIPEKTLLELESRLESDEIQETKHIGLSNVNQRIKLIFGDEYGLNVYSDDFETIIDVILPVKE